MKYILLTSVFAAPTSDYSKPAGGDYGYGPKSLPSPSPAVYPTAAPSQSPPPAPSVVPEHGGDYGYGGKPSPVPSPSAIPSPSAAPVHGDYGYGGQPSPAVPYPAAATTAAVYDVQTPLPSASPAPVVATPCDETPVVPSPAPVVATPCGETPAPAVATEPVPEPSAEPQATQTLDSYGSSSSSLYMGAVTIIALFLQ